MNNPQSLRYAGIEKVLNEFSKSMPGHSAACLLVQYDNRFEGAIYDAEIAGSEMRYYALDSSAPNINEAMQALNLQCNEFLETLELEEEGI